jgi:hypothetical protein
MLREKKANSQANLPEKFIIARLPVFFLIIKEIGWEGGLKA